MWAPIDYFLQVVTLAIMWNPLENVLKTIMDTNSFIKKKNHGNNITVLHALFNVENI